MRCLLTVASSIAALVVALFVYRRLFVAGKRAPKVSLAGKTILVTGTSPGSIGIAAARILASWGARVVVTTRSNPEAAARVIVEAVPGADVHAHALDLCDPVSVRAFAAWYTETIGDRLDVLVNCAGIHLDLVNDWKAPKLTTDGHEIHYRTNYLGTVHLTTLLLPLLEKTAAAAGEARVVNVVSHLHAMAKNEELFAVTRPYNSWRAYGRSKLALMHDTGELERRYGATGLHAYSLHPGSVYSKVADKGLAGKRVLGAIRRALAPIEKIFLKTIDEGAQTIVLCATAPGLEGGAYFEDCATKRASDETLDRDVAKKLYDETQAWVTGIEGAR